MKSNICLYSQWRREEFQYIDTHKPIFGVKALIVWYHKSSILDIIFPFFFLSLLLSLSLSLHLSFSPSLSLSLSYLSLSLSISLSLSLSNSLYFSLPLFISLSASLYLSHSLTCVRTTDVSSLEICVRTQSFCTYVLHSRRTLASIKHGRTLSVPHSVSLRDYYNNFPCFNETI